MKNEEESSTRVYSTFDELIILKYRIGPFIAAMLSILLLCQYYDALTGDLLLFCPLVSSIAFCVLLGIDVNIKYYTVEYDNIRYELMITILQGSVVCTITAAVSALIAYLLF